MTVFALALGATLLAAGSALATCALVLAAAGTGPSQTPSPVPKPCGSRAPSVAGEPWRRGESPAPNHWSHASTKLLRPLAGLCHAAAIPVAPAWIIAASLALGALAVRLLLPLENPPLLLVAGSLGAVAPVGVLRMRARARREAVRRLVGPALAQLAQLVRVRRHPYLALADLVPGLPKPLRKAMDDALASCRGGTPLPDSLREAARTLGDEPYLNQLAELVNLSLAQGSDLAASLDRLVERYRTVQELQAEEHIQAAGYRRLAWALFAGSQLPVVWHAVSGGASLAYLTEHPLLRLFTFWSAISGLAVVMLPHLLSPEAI